MGTEMNDFEKILIGALLGAFLTYVPRFLANKQKLAAHRALLCIEIEKCLQMSNTYLTDNVQAPAYRLPSLGLAQSIPQIPSIGTISGTQIAAIQDFYIEVAALNRGLDQADKQIGIDGRLEQEYKRNLLKSKNIVVRHEKAKQAAELITKWPWIV